MDLEAARMPVLTEDGSPGGFLIFFGWVSERRRKVTKLSVEFSHRATCLRLSSQFCYSNISLTNVSIWRASPGVVGERGVKLRARLQAWGRHGISIGHHDIWRQERLLHRQNRADHGEIFTLLLVNHVKAKFRSERSLKCRGEFFLNSATFFLSSSYLGTKGRIRSPFIFSCKQKKYFVRDSAMHLLKYILRANHLFQYITMLWCTLLELGKVSKPFNSVYKKE